MKLVHPTESVLFHPTVKMRKGREEERRGGVLPLSFSHKHVERQGKCFNTKQNAGSSQDGSHTKKKMNLQQITDFK